MLNLVSDSSCDLISGELNSPLRPSDGSAHVPARRRSGLSDTPELDIPALLSKLAITVPLPPVPPRRLCRGLRAGRGNRLRDHLLSAFRLL